MYGTANKKMLNMLILDILKRYSDEEHHLTQQEVMKLLKREYGMECDRRSVKNNVEYLNELGYEIPYDDGYWLVTREFEDAELRVLIDSVLSSKSITNKQAKELISKLEKMSSRYFEPKVSHVCAAETTARTDNKQVLYTVSALNDAIEQKKKVHFKHGRYGTDMELHKRKADYIINPYQMIVANSRYYLLGNVDKYDDISYYRIDKILDLEILDERRKPQEQVKGLEHGLDLPKHMAEHVYMYCGPSSPIKLRCTKSTIDSLVDWFGKDIRILEQNDDRDEITVRIHCNENAMFYGALQYGAYVEVLEPKELRKDISKAVHEMCEKYDDLR